MTEHNMFETAMKEAKSFLTAIKDNFDTMWEEISPYCMYRNDNGEFCTHGGNTELSRLCTFKDCPYVKDSP